jgi:hypothetical protein
MRCVLIRVRASKVDVDVGKADDASFTGTQPRRDDIGLGSSDPFAVAPETLEAFDWSKLKASINPRQDMTKHSSFGYPIPATIRTRLFSTVPLYNPRNSRATELISSLSRGLVY